MRVQLVLMVDCEAESPEALMQQVSGMDWVALHEVWQGGEEPEAFVSGGCNPIRVDVPGAT